MKRLLIPVDLGGSPQRCAIHPQAGSPPSPELLRALIDHYLTERAPAGQITPEVAFFRGGIPDDALLAAGRPFPMRVACSPADLSPAVARHLRDQGVQTIEVELLSFDSQVLRDCRRGYRGRAVLPMIDGLRKLGFSIGAVLSPGLPGSSHQSALADVDQLLGPTGPRVDFVRIYPALAFVGSDLARWESEGRWRPMHLGEAVTTVCAMLDVLDRAELEVIRIGLQPGQDVPYQVSAGPLHPNLRGLVETRRFRARMATALGQPPPGSHIILLVNPKDLSWAKGTSNENIRALRASLQLRQLTIMTDVSIERGRVEVA